MIRALLRHHRWLLAGGFAAAVALVFALRVGHAVRDWPAGHDADIEGWMTPRYIVLSRDVPPEVVAGALGLSRDRQGRRVTIGELAEERGVRVEELAAALDAAIAAFRAAR